MRRNAVQATSMHDIYAALWRKEDAFVSTAAASQCPSVAC